VQDHMMDRYKEKKNHKPMSLWTPCVQ